jgi:hypothetical protein
MGSTYACMCMCEDVLDRAWYNVRHMKEIKGDGENFWRNEEVRRRPGELSISKLFLRG